MKKLVQFIATALVSLSLAGGVAAAVESNPGCSISNTGADSVNTCVNEETNDITITCKNDTDVIFVNDQNSGSGSATVSGNTSGGSANSGQAGNINFTYLTDNISCGPKTSSVTPPTGGQGSGPVTTVSTPAKAPVVKTLPKTGDSSKLAVAAIATAVFAGIAAVARFGSVAFRKLS